MSKARWMSKAIAAIKLVLLKAKIFSELPPNRIMTQAQAILIERLVKFVILPWVKWWIRCPLAAEAGLVDLELLRDIRAFPDPTVSGATSLVSHRGAQSPGFVFLLAGHKPEGCTVLQVTVTYARELGDLPVPEQVRLALWEARVP